MTAPTADLAARLQTVVHVSRVSGEPSDCAEYSIDGVVPSAVLRPTSADEIREVVSFAAREKLAVVPVGSRSKLGIGTPPSRYDVAVDLTELSRVAHYDPADLTVSVDAGTRLAHLAEVLSKENQFVPLAVPFFDECTVGGTTASGVDSSLTGLYGSARDFLIGAEFIDGAGKKCKSGGRVVKNVTGYDLHKLLIGSLGTLAVITRLNFRVFPLPTGYGTLVVTFPSLPEALRLKGRIAASPLAGVGVDILSPAMAEFLPSWNAHTTVSARWFSQSHCHVLISYEGGEAILKRSAQDLSQLARELRAASLESLEPNFAHRLRMALREMYAHIGSSSPLATMLRLVFLPSLCGLVEQLQASADRLSLRCAWLLRAPGTLYFWLLPEQEDERALAVLSQAARQMQHLASENQAHFSIPRCPAALKRGVNIWGRPRPDARLMRRIKAAFDPHNIFAPGRFLDGL
jgi:glycolate oxidase FAD binding subunit